MKKLIGIGQLTAHYIKQLSTDIILLGEYMRLQIVRNKIHNLSRRYLSGFSSYFSFVPRKFLDDQIILCFWKLNGAWHPVIKLLEI